MNVVICNCCVDQFGNDDFIDGWQCIFVKMYFVWDLSDQVRCGDGMQVCGCGIGICDFIEEIQFGFMYGQMFIDGCCQVVGIIG